MEGKAIAGSVIGLAIAVIIIAYLVPPALNAFYGVDAADTFGHYTEPGNESSPWIEDEAVTGLWYLLPLFVVLAIVIAIIAIALTHL
jgi:hypothetical protein